MKYINEFLKYFSAFPAFTARDARLFLGRHGASAAYCRLFMRNMIKGEKVFSIGRGRYTLHDDPMMAGFAFSPFYYGLESALTYHRLWDYVTPITIITTNRVRKTSIVLLGRNATVRRIKRRNFFGYSLVPYKDGVYIPVSDIEKTLIDSIYFHAPFSNDVYAAIAKKVDMKRLREYLTHYNKAVKTQIGAALSFGRAQKA